MNTPKCNHLTLLHFKGLTTARLLGDQILNTALGLVRDQSKEGNQKVVHVKSRLNHWFIGFYEWWMQNFNLSALTSQRILPSVKAMLREITTRKSSIYWTSNVTSVTEVRSVSARLLVHGTPGECYYNTLLCCDYFSSSSVALKFGQQPHLLCYRCAKFSFLCNPHCRASPRRKISYSITYTSYLMPWETKRVHFGIYAIWHHSEKTHWEK